MNDNSTNELRIKRGSVILGYIRQFSSTEKALFAGLVLVAIVSALVMAVRANSFFMTEVPAAGGDLHEGIVGLPRTINPVLAITDVDRDLAGLVYSGLTKYEDGEIVADLAKDWTISNDGLTYTFTLRDDISFHDGRPVTSADVAFTIQKIQDPAVKSPRRIDWSNVAVKELSPNEVQFVLKEPYAPFLTNTTLGIMPKHIWGTVNDEQFIFSQYNIEPLGSGPYKVHSIARDGGGIPTVYRLTTWRGYHNDEPFIKTISFHFYADEDKVLEALDHGAIDSVATISPSAASRLATDSAQAYTVLSTPLPRIFGVFLNQNQNPILADKVIRQALDMSVDRNLIVEQVLNGYGVPIQGPLPVNISSTTISTATTSDIVSAQELLEKNGWEIGDDGIYTKSSKRLSFDIYTADSPDLKLAAELVEESWTTLGAEVTVKVFEPSDLYQNVIRTRKYDALLFGEFVGKDRDVYAFWHSSQRNSPGLNVALYANSTADELLEEIRTTQSENERLADYSRFDKTIRADIPAIFLYAPDFIYVVPKAVRNIQLAGATIPTDRWNNVSEWYVRTENVWKIFAQNKLLSRITNQIQK